MKFNSHNVITLAAYLDCWVTPLKPDYTVPIELHFLSIHIQFVLSFLRDELVNVFAHYAVSEHHKKLTITASDWT